MSAEEGASRVWSRRRWLAVIAFVMMLQVGLVFWSRERKPANTPLRLRPPIMYLPPDQTAALPGLEDPTLFVLANRHGFSGRAWLDVPVVENQLKEWTEPEPLPATKPELGRTFEEYVRSKLSRPFEVARKPEPQLDEIEYVPPASLTSAQSTFRIEGDLARRRLLSSFKLDAWPAAEILTNSEVLVAVNPEGAVFSAVLLARCGPDDDPGAGAADDRAVALAKSARFQPLRWNGPTPPSPVSPASLTWGRLVFHWQTSAPPATNAAPGSP